MNNYFNNLINIISNSISSMDENLFEKLVQECIDTLDNGGKIIVSGLGKNVPVCEKFVGTMISLGLNANFMNTNTAVHGDIGMVGDKDLVIVLTKSGETVESVYLTELLKKRNAKMWLLSFRKDSTLTREIPNALILELKHEGDMWDIVPNNSTVVNLIVLQALAMQIAERKNISLSDFKKNHPGGHIGEQLKNV